MTTAPRGHGPGREWLLTAALPPDPGAPHGRQAVLLATDASAASGAATRHAIDLARHLAARLVVASVIDDAHFGGLGARRADQIREERTAAVRVIVGEALHAGVAEASFLVWVGNPGGSIVEAAIAERAALIVIGSGAERTDRPGRRSLSAAVERDAPCAVVVIRAGAA